MLPPGQIMDTWFGMKDCVKCMGDTADGSVSEATRSLIVGGDGDCKQPPVCGCAVVECRYDQLGWSGN